MGASEFTARGRGMTAKEAFAVAVEDAAYEHGHGGYTGTIAEKSTFVELVVPAGADPREVARKAMEGGEFDDKWGPAGAVCLRRPEGGKGRFAGSPGVWLFFGVASD